MRREDFQRMMNLVQDRFLQEAEDWRPQKRRPGWIAWAALAACLCLVIGLGSRLLPMGMGAASSGGTGIARDTADGASPSVAEDEGSDEAAPAEGGSYAGGEADAGAASFMNYAGPVLPLTLEEENSSVTAQRNLTFDFSGYGTEAERWTDDITGETYEWENGKEDMTVTDQYVLTNTSDTGQTVTLLYPFISHFAGLELPDITLDGAALETELYAGGYAGGFQGVLKADGPDGTTYNLLPPDDWTDYQALLSDGSYLEDALYGEWSLDEPVTVYWFRNPTVRQGEGTAPTLELAAEIDYDRTAVFGYGFEGRTIHRENGVFRAGFFVSERETLRCLVVVGDDLTGYTLQGYQNGACEAGTEIDVTCDVIREETDWSTVLGQLLTDYQDNYRDRDRIAVPDEMLLRGICQTLLRYGGLSDAPVDRYDSNYLEDIISESLTFPRVFYASAQITVPAGESVTFAARFIQPPSFDYGCSGSENVGLNGYDLVTRVGTNLTFTGLTAEIVNAGEVELVRQNYGFDLEHGVTSVILDPETEHYYMEVRRITQKEEEP